MAFGDYPAEYNPKVHGPYDPARFYGKRKLITMLNWIFLPEICSTLHNRCRTPQISFQYSFQSVMVIA